MARRIMASSVTSSRWSHCAMPALLTTYCAGTVHALSKFGLHVKTEHECHFLAGHAGRQAGEWLLQSTQAPKPNASMLKHVVGLHENSVAVSLQQSAQAPMLHSCMRQACAGDIMEAALHMTVCAVASRPINRPRAGKLSASKL